MNDEVGFKAPDTFDVLRERTRSLRAKTDHVEWSSIALEMQGFPLKKSRSYGLARIDNSLFRNLTGGEPTSFRVEPGEHTVTVRLSRWLRLWGFRGSWKRSIKVAVEPGEQVKLVCGLRPGAKDEWTKIQIASIRPALWIGAGVFLIGFVVRFLIPMIGWLLAPASIFIQVRGVWVSQTAIRLMLNIALCAILFVPWYYLGKRLILDPNRRDLHSLRYRFTDPYFLKKAEEPLHGRELDLEMGRGRGSTHAEPA